MDRIERKFERAERRKQYRQGRHMGSHVGTGLLILAIGVIGLMKALMFPIPDWMFSWKVLLIALGFFVGVRHQFRGAGWLILMLIGGIFLMNDLLPELAFQRYSWSLALIIIGGWLIFRPRNRFRHMQGAATATDTVPEPGQENFSSEDFIDNTTVFGGIKKTILSKNFKGGDIVNIMGGSEINLSQADLQGLAELEITQVFGGTKLIVPPHWEIKQEVVAIFGGVEDKRPLQQVNNNPGKTLVLKGTTLFGGIDIRSY